MGFILILFGLVLIPATVFVVRERAAARRAGMSASTPVCAACHYRLGGWASSTCPECGTDIRACGVRTGPRSRRAVAGLLVVFVAMFVVGPIAGVMLHFVFAESRGSAHARLSSTAVPDTSLTIEVEYEWRRFPPKVQEKTALVLVHFPEGTRFAGGAWMNGRYRGPAVRREQVLVVTDDLLEDDNARIEDAVRDVLGDDAADDIVMAHARETRALGRDVLTRIRSGTLGIRVIAQLSGEMWQYAGSSGGAGGTGTSWPAMLLTVLAVVGAGWVGFRTVVARQSRGWRKPTDGEWARVSAD